MATPAKGKGKGAPPPPKAMGGEGAAPPRPKVQPKPPSLKKGLTFAEEREARFKKQEEKHAEFELDEGDIPEYEKVEAGPVVVCPRCELKVREELFPSHWAAHSSEILPWLFLGGQRNAENDKELKVRTKVNHLLCVAADATMALPLSVQELNLVAKVMPLVDNDTQDPVHFQQVIQEAVSYIKSVHEAGEQNRILVYCIQGISRSASITIAYLMVEERMHLRDAFNHVKSRRSVADPRPLFVEQLGKLELKLFPDLTAPTLTPADVIGDRKLLDLEGDPVKQYCPEVSEETDLVEMRLAAGKGVGFYTKAAVSLLNGTEDKKPANPLRISALGNAVSVAAAVAMRVEREGAGSVKRIRTAYPDVSGGRRGCPQIILDVAPGRLK